MHLCEPGRQTRNKLLHLIPLGQSSVPHDKLQETTGMRTNLCCQLSPRSKPLNLRAGSCARVPSSSDSESAIGSSTSAGVHAKLSAESEPVKAGRACAWSTKAEMKTTEDHVVERSSKPYRAVSFAGEPTFYDLLCFVLYGAQNQTLPETPPLAAPSITVVGSYAT